MAGSDSTDDICFSTLKSDFIGLPLTVGESRNEFNDVDDGKSLAPLKHR